MGFRPQELSQHHQYRTPGNTSSNPGTQLMAQKEQEGHAARDHWGIRCHGCRELPDTRSDSTATDQVPAQRRQPAKRHTFLQEAVCAYSSDVCVGLCHRQVEDTG